MKLAGIDSTARVADGARIADDVEVGPYCTIGPHVELRAGVRLLSHVNVSGVTVIGERSVVYPFASLGTPPQSNAYRGASTRLLVGSDCRIREGVTINTGSEDGGSTTSVGDRCFLMANSHVAHDCTVGNDVTFANNAVIGGHVSLGNHVFLGGNCSVLQFVRVGEGAMLGGGSGITADVIPFGFAFGPKAKLVGLNTIGLQRRSYSRADMHRLRRAYRMLFVGAGTFATRVVETRAAFQGDPLVEIVLAFIRDRGGRALMMPSARGAEAGDGTAP
jgi:UDP-N-acetylglucosamine acyltransferase